MNKHVPLLFSAQMLPIKSFFELKPRDRLAAQETSRS
jgi:hypothetical protein